jgi:hypothetical protein
MSAMNPHVSDEQISDQFTFGPLIVDAMHGYLSGANFIRDLYEPLVTSQKERIEELEYQLAMAEKAYNEACQHIRENTDPK